MVVPDACRRSAVQRQHAGQRQPGIRFYVGAPVFVRGQRIGAMQVFAPSRELHPIRGSSASSASLLATVGRLFELKDEARVRARTAAELIREEWRHALTLEAGKVGSWVWDIQSNGQSSANDILRRMYGFPPTGDDHVRRSLSCHAARRPARGRRRAQADVRGGRRLPAEFRIEASGRWLVGARARLSARRRRASRW